MYADPDSNGQSVLSNPANVTDQKQSNADWRRRVVSVCADHGPITLSCGIYGDVIRFPPALTISNELKFKGFDILELTLRKKSP